VQALRQDLVAIFKRGWWLIALFWGTGLVGGATQVVTALYSHRHWHAPSPWWVVLVFAGFAFAELLVIRDRRLGSEHGKTLTQSVIKTFQSMDTISVSLPQPGGDPIMIEGTRNLEVSGTTVAEPPAQQLTLQQPEPQQESDSES